jgi:hypothetical protein
LCIIYNHIYIISKHTYTSTDAHRRKIERRRAGKSRGEREGERE